MGLFSQLFFCCSRSLFIQNKGYFFKLSFLRAYKSRQPLNWTRKHISALIYLKHVHILLLIKTYLRIMTLKNPDSFIQNWIA